MFVQRLKKSTSIQIPWGRANDSAFFKRDASGTRPAKKAFLLFLKTIHFLVKAYFQRRLEKRLLI